MIGFAPVFAFAALAAPPPVPPAPSPAAAVPARGLWLGPLQLCRDTVEAVGTAVDKFTLERVFTVTFRPLVQPRLERETTRLVGSVIPIRLHGRLISEPRVNEPIVGLQLQIGPMPHKSEAIRRAAAGACYRSE